VEKTYAIELKNITKRFGSVTANNKINLAVKKYEILSILGENGSGKTTLMNILSGIYRPDEGAIFIDGKEVTIHSPKDAYAFKIGMIHQHYKLVNVLTAAENIILGQPGTPVLDMEQVKKEINSICSQYGFILNLDQKIYDMSVSQKQTVEIVKVLYRGADILILDEPTAVLTPQEIKSLFSVLRNMRKAGKSIIIITHKLQEVLDISDRVTVLRKGSYISSVNTADATISVLTEMMVGEKINLDINRSEPHDQQDRLIVQHLTCRNKEGLKALDDVSFCAKSGEILGIAGIAGSGMKELLEAIAGIQSIEEGSICYCCSNCNKITISGLTPNEIKHKDVAISFVPEDRLGMGLVGSMGVTGNVMLKSYQTGVSPFVNRWFPRRLAEKIISMLQVSTPGTEFPVRRLSGGNVQKVLVGREISSDPGVLMVAYPVRGLDINSSYTIYNQLNAEKEKGVAVISVIEDLDVILELCDRILVLNNGRITGIRDARNTTKEEIGLLMTADGDHMHE
jgi:general nucleoside transport system ATP-binding protein